MAVFCTECGTEIRNARIIFTDDSGNPLCFTCSSSYEEKKEIAPASSTVSPKVKQPGFCEVCGRQILDGSDLFCAFCREDPVKVLEALIARAQE